MHLVFILVILLASLAFAFADDIVQIPLTESGKFDTEDIVQWNCTVIQVSKTIALPGVPFPVHAIFRRIPNTSPPQFVFGEHNEYRLVWARSQLRWIVSVAESSFPLARSPMQSWSAMPPQSRWFPNGLSLTCITSDLTIAPET
eukprot:GABV01001580.1.p1 GENE.GABV01001580.1~~GABV01001580.1.p1  ORF type:complete len:144 (-),score=30.35 GABV01001580.1:58-489(-)